MKTLKSHLLKTLLIQFYETRDLSSPKWKLKLLFYAGTFFSPANRRGELWILGFKFGNEQFTMDYVRHGKIQGHSLIFLKSHCPCILPCLT